jgi:hypothetical protein
MQMIGWSLTTGFSNFDDRLPEQRESKITSTDVRTSIVFKSLPVNTNSSIRCTFDFDSNVTDVSDLQWLKHDWINIEIDDEIHVRWAVVGWMKSSLKISITLSRTNIRRENAITILGVLRCDSHWCFPAWGEAIITHELTYSTNSNDRNSSWNDKKCWVPLHRSDW